jgi:hypothetical protein
MPACSLQNFLRLFCRWFETSTRAKSTRKATEIWAKEIELSARRATGQRVPGRCRGSIGSGVLREVSTNPWLRPCVHGRF